MLNRFWGDFSSWHAMSDEKIVAFLIFGHDFFELLLNTHAFFFVC